MALPSKRLGAEKWIDTRHGRRRLALGAIVLALFQISVLLIAIATSDSASIDGADDPTPPPALVPTSTPQTVATAVPQPTSSPVPSRFIATLTPLPTTAATAMQTPISTATPTRPATATPTPTATAVPTRTATVTPTPTAAATPTPTVTAVAIQVTAQSTGIASALRSEMGRSRSNPYPFGSTVTSPEWEIQVSQVIRGDEAWNLIQEASEYNDPPRDGNEYILIGLTARYTGSGQGDVSVADFAITGSRGVLWHPLSGDVSSAGGVSVYRDSGVSKAPEPSIEATLLSGGTSKGWVLFELTEGESGLILLHGKGRGEYGVGIGGYASAPIVSSISNINLDEDIRYISVQENSSVGLQAELRLPSATNIGTSPERPAPIGSKATNSYFELEVLEYRRGEGVREILEGIAHETYPLDPGMEFVAVRIRARSVDESRYVTAINGSMFRSAGERRKVYDTPIAAILDSPADGLSAALYPGAAYEGWVVVQAGVGEEELLVVFEPSPFYEPFIRVGAPERRYLAIS